MSLSKQLNSNTVSAARLGLVFTVLLLSGCTQSPRSQDIVLPDETPASKNDPYPDFSKPLASAMEQMSDEDARKMQAQLSSLAARRKAGAISEAEYWRRVREMQALSETMKQPPAQ